MHDLLADTWDLLTMPNAYICYLGLKTSPSIWIWRIRSILISVVIPKKKAFALADMEINSLNWFCSICYDYESSTNKNHEQSKQSQTDIDGLSQGSRGISFMLSLPWETASIIFTSLADSLSSRDFVIITFHYISVFFSWPLCIHFTWVNWESKQFHM